MIKIRPLIFLLGITVCFGVQAQSLELSAVESFEQALQQVERLTSQPEVCDNSDTGEIKWPIKRGQLKTPNGVGFEVSVISKELVQKLFQEMANQAQIPFAYPEDGCYARAHEMSILLEAKGIITGKILVESGPPNENFKRQIYLWVGIRHIYLVAEKIHGPQYLLKGWRLWLQ